MKVNQVLFTSVIELASASAFADDITIERLTAPLSLAGIK